LPLGRFLLTGTKRKIGSSHRKDITVGKILISLNISLTKWYADVSRRVKL